jgi:hypothetical protein
MRFLAFPISLLAAMLISVAPVSVPADPTMQAGISNASGPVASCPVTINLVGKITFAPGVVANANRQVQYKWISSASLLSDFNQETQTLTFPVGAARTTQVVTTPWHVSPTPYAPRNGAPFDMSVGASVPGRVTAWAALQISYPAMSNNTSNKATFTLTCPTTGFLQNSNMLK